MAQVTLKPWMKLYEWNEAAGGQCWPVTITGSSTVDAGTSEGVPFNQFNQFYPFNPFNQFYPFNQANQFNPFNQFNQFNPFNPV